MTRLLLSISFIVLFNISSQAQPEQLTNERSREIQSDSLPILVDSLTIIPESVVVSDQNGNTIPASDYLLFRNELYSVSNDLPEVLVLKYRVLPFDLYKNYSHLDTSKIEVDDAGDYIGFDFLGQDI